RLDLEGALVDADRLAPAVLGDEEAPEGDQGLGVPRPEGHQLALDLDGARDVAGPAVDLDEPASRRFVPRIALACALEKGQLLDGRGATRLGQETHACRGILGPKTGHDTPAVERLLLVAQR